MSSQSTAKMLGRLGQSGVIDNRLSEQTETEVYDAPRLSHSTKHENENDIKNVLMHALGGPSKKATPMERH